MYADVESEFFRVNERIKNLEENRPSAIGRECTKIVAHIDPRLHKSNELLSNQKTSENQFFTYIFKTLVNKITRLELRIDGLESK